MKLTNKIITVCSIFLLSACSDGEPIDEGRIRGLNVSQVVNETEFLYFINEQRGADRQCGENSYIGIDEQLNLKPDLSEVSLSHGFDLIMSRTFSNFGSGTQYDDASPGDGNGSTLWNRVDYFNYKSDFVAELIYKNVSKRDLPILAVDNWVEDNFSCKILHNPKYKNIGLATYKENNKFIYVATFSSD